MSVETGYTLKTLPKGHYLEPYQLHGSSAAAASRPPAVSRRADAAANDKREKKQQEEAARRRRGTVVDSDTLNVVVVHFKSAQEPVMVRHLPARDFVDYIAEYQREDAAGSASADAPATPVRLSDEYNAAACRRRRGRAVVRPNTDLAAAAADAHNAVPSATTAVAAENDDFAPARKKAVCPGEERRVLDAIAVYAQPRTVLSVPSGFSMPHVPRISRPSSTDSDAAGSSAGPRTPLVILEAEPVVHDYYLPPEVRGRRLREQREQHQLKSFLKSTVVAGYDRDDFQQMQQEDRRALLAHERRRVFLRQFQRDLQTVYGSAANILYRNTMAGEAADGGAEGVAAGGSSVYDVNYQLGFHNTAGNGGIGDDGLLDSAAAGPGVLYTVGRELPEEHVQTYFLLNDNYHSAVAAARLRCRTTRDAAATYAAAVQRRRERAAKAEADAQQAGDAAQLQSLQEKHRLQRQRQTSRLVALRRDHKEATQRLHHLLGEMAWGDALLFRQQHPAEGVVVVRVRNRNYARGGLGGTDAANADYDDDETEGEEKDEVELTYRYGSADYF